MTTQELGGYPFKKRLLLPPRIRLCIYAIAGCLFIISTLVAVGWLTHVEPLVQICDGCAPMQINTAICFFLSALALLYTCRQAAYFSHLCANIVAAFSLLTFLQYPLNSNWGIDTLLISKFFVVAHTEYLGRMAPNTALAFVFASMALLITTTGKPSFARTTIAALLASLTTGLGITVLMSYGFDVDVTVGWGRSTIMALPTATAMTLLGIGCILATYPDAAVCSRVLWASLAITEVLIAFVIGLWLALLNTEALANSRIPDMFFLIGLLLVSSVFIALHYYHVTRQHAEALGKQVEAQHLMANKLFHDMVASTPDAVIIVDDRGIIKLANAPTTTMFGYPQNELIGNMIELLLPSHLQSSHAHFRHAFFADPKPRRMGAGRALSGRRKDGSEFPMDVSLGPIQTHEGTVVSCMICDISERLAAEKNLANKADELARSNQELNSFAFIASHDLRAPLRGVTQLATWIEEDAGDTLSPKIHEYLQRMRGRIQRMDRLLEDLLAYSRIDKTESAKCEHVDIRLLAEDAFALSLPKPGLQLKLPEHLPSFTTARVPLEQVFRNLIGNAIKHHDGDEGIIRISASQQKNFYLFTVADNGPGIPPELHQKAFAMFQTLRPRDEVEGSGMGLAMVKKIVELHGGEITLHSDGKRGTVVCFTWPITAILPEVQNGRT